MDLQLKRVKQAVQHRLTATTSAFNINTGLAPETSPQISAEMITTGQVNLKQANTVAVNRRSLKSDPRNEQKLLDDIGTVYYNEDPSFDCGLYELKKLPPQLDPTQINKDRRSKKDQLAVVNKKVANLIMQNHPSYAAELTKVTELHSSLRDALHICLQSRRRLKNATDLLAGTGLRLLAKHSKKQRLNRLLVALETVKTLHETDYRLRELLEENNFAGAIHLCQQCQLAAETYKQFVCIGELTCKLSTTLDCIEQHLDAALTVCLTRFHVDTYVSLLTAYAMLDKTEQVHTRLLHCMSTAMHHSAYNALYNYVDTADIGIASVNTDIQTHCNGGGESDQKLKSYQLLCQRVSSSNANGAVRELLHALWMSLHAYQCMTRYHVHQEEATTGQSVTCAVISDDYEMPSMENASRMRVLLSQSMRHVWQMAEQKVDVFLQSVDFTCLQFDSFLEIVDLIDKFTSIGRSHFACVSPSVEETLSTHAKEYFQRYHRQRIDELGAFLESEVWHICPVQRDFDVWTLQEFKFLREGERNNSPSKIVLEDSRSNLPETLLLLATDADNAFELIGTSHDQDLSSSGQLNQKRNRTRDTEENESDEECMGDLNSPNQLDTINNNNAAKSIVYKALNEWNEPVLCNTAVNVLRLLGRYMHIMHVVPSISFEIMSSFAQVYDLLLYSVYRYFGADCLSHGVQFRSDRLSEVLRRIENTSNALAHGHLIKQNGVSTCLAVDSPVDLFALPQRVVAVESLLFVSAQLQSLAAALEQCLPKSKRAFVQQFFAQTVVCSVDMRLLVYGCVSSRALDYNHLLAAVSGTNWSIDELMSQHNWYIDHLLKDLSTFKQRIEKVHLELMNLPKECYNQLWDSCVHCCVRILIEGYATPGRRCTNEGRALMQLDLQHWIRKLETLTDLRPIPHTDLVLAYVKAYYLPESALEQWVKDKREVYTTRQLTTLLNVCSHISKKTKDNLIKQMDNTTPMSTN